MVYLLARRLEDRIAAKSAVTKIVELNCLPAANGVGQLVWRSRYWMHRWLVASIVENVGWF